MVELLKNFWLYPWELCNGIYNVSELSSSLITIHNLQIGQKKTRGAPLISVKPLDNWLLIYTQEIMKQPIRWIQNLFKVTPAMGIQMKKSNNVSLSSHFYSGNWLYSHLKLWELKLLKLLKTLNYLKDLIKFLVWWTQKCVRIIKNEWDKKKDYFRQLPLSVLEFLWLHGCSWYSIY